jgi:hypothetical protein
MTAFRQVRNSFKSPLIVYLSVLTLLYLSLMLVLPPYGWVKHNHLCVRSRRQNKCHRRPVLVASRTELTTGRLFDLSCVLTPIMTIVQFAPFSSLVQSSFWHELTNLKIDVLRLSDAPIPITASYAAGRSIKDRETGADVALGCHLVVGGEAFAKDHSS